jgi:hypothetical protein
MLVYPADACDIAYWYTKSRDDYVLFTNYGRALGCWARYSITRRVENRNQMLRVYEPLAIQPSYACCTITMTKNHPRNACLGSCK